jgi:hypothetical protein
MSFCRNKFQALFWVPQLLGFFLKKKYIVFLGVIWLHHPKIKHILTKHTIYRTKPAKSSWGQNNTKKARHPILRRTHLNPKIPAKLLGAGQ